MMVKLIINGQSFGMPLVFVHFKQKDIKWQSTPSLPVHILKLNMLTHLPIFDHGRSVQPAKIKLWETTDNRLEDAVPHPSVVFPFPSW
jgi:hypothetical protein